MKISGIFAVLWFIGSLVGFVYMLGVKNAALFVTAQIVGFMVLYGLQRAIRG